MCNADCDLDQGRHCHCSLLATRRALGLHRIEPAAPEIGYEAAWLQQREGGCTVDTEPEDSHPWAFYCIAGLVAVAALASPAFFM